MNTLRRQVGQDSSIETIEAHEFDVIVRSDNRFISMKGSSNEMRMQNYVNGLITDMIHLEK